VYVGGLAMVKGKSGDSLRGGEVDFIVYGGAQWSKYNRVSGISNDCACSDPRYVR